MRARRLKKIWKANPCDKTWEEFRIARNYKGTLIKRAMRQAYRKRVADACDSEKGMWQFSRWSQKKTVQRAPIPTIEGETEPKGKAQKFISIFFPPPPKASDQDIQNYTYPDRILTHHTITQYEICTTISNAPSRKTPGSDGRPNEILRVALEPLITHLHRIFNACLALGFHPSHFKNSITIVLRKPAGERDYTQAKSYRPIALLNTIGKFFESIITQRLSYMTETHQLLPITHFGGRKSTSTENAAHFLIERIISAWNNNKIASLLLLDVAGAFDNVVHQRLLQNLRKRRVGEMLVQWIASFLTDRTTILKTGEYTTEQLHITSGIPQGSPLSAILYLFYNADLLENINSQPHACSLGYVDDIGILVTADTIEENCENLSLIHTETCEPWADTHGSKFSIAKYQLTHFTRRTSANVDYPLSLTSNHQIQPSSPIIYLGLAFDGKLRWNAQINRTKTKVLKSIGALASLAGSTWGANLQAVRKIYCNFPDDIRPLNLVHPFGGDSA